tara:strand:- start:268 stop:603 length:336 start_codon:yes stop_codon:yes gene_type:complete
VTEEFTTYKCWRLKDRRELRELRMLVADEIVPRYSMLPGCLRLRLELVHESDTVLTIQVWEDRETWQTVLESESYARWFREYEPILAQWDGMVTFLDEWTTESLEIDPRAD